MGASLRVCLLESGGVILEDLSGLLLLVLPVLEVDFARVNE